MPGAISCAARSTVSNIEAERHRLQEDHARIIDGSFGTGRLLEPILWYARMGRDLERLRQFIQYERPANSIRWYHGQVLPLPLQTDEYTWALVQPTKHKDLDKVHAGRLERKRCILTNDHLASLWFLIDEAVLARPIGGRDVMRAQLAHLREMADRRDVILRVAPFEAGEYQGMDGPIQIISQESRDVAYSGAQGAAA